MLKFWLVAAILVPIVVTYLGVTEGFEKWVYYYPLGAIAILMYFSRKWMMKRMEKHMQFLAEQKRKEEEK